MGEDLHDGPDGEEGDWLLLGVWLFRRSGRPSGSNMQRNQEHKKKKTNAINIAVLLLLIIDNHNHYKRSLYICNVLATSKKRFK